jgi:hypothetical protein
MAADEHNAAEIDLDLPVALSKAAKLLFPYGGLSSKTA